MGQLIRDARKLLKEFGASRWASDQGLMKQATLASRPRDADNAN
jgi:hypothetical protein